MDDINSVDTTTMLHECLRVLVAVLERAPNLDQRTSFLLEKEPIVARVRQLTEMDSSKPYSKARFYVQLFWEDGSNPASMTCHRFINQDFDILSNSIIVEPTLESFAVSSLNTTGINNHIRESNAYSKR
ncbi:uncharacterized protein TRIVIDRAFT_69091 [Trichoderma virens Gv29-8]|uniref:Uncharacterized protein n=1 Tax=Hypocrea virens (strain Gv29-8 / FGSC 10586) TaxID=413071 RepID=G9MYE4_HYPVG|nr:uncharacterized protein TRIVIDRAFT_69091 [Trichoderma virens Gv29-8]EHK20566.1 hypothetical protein TRIVIDRAFT_69091 [Trichoderma virens Gv29-8]UKZ53024.1 hypothetical protein TrVGV298_006811 [Trichoderma virens]